MKDKILIVGGYGQVGKFVTLELANAFPKHVIVAGRSLAKANDFALENGNLFETLELDIYDKKMFLPSIVNIKIVIMCLSPSNNDFSKYCIENGIHYVDISPSYDVVKKVEQFKAEAENNHSTCVLGVGLSPGLSNLLVKKLCQNMTVLKEVNINLMLGLGEAHGQDGVKWLLDNIKSDFIVNDTRIKPFGKCRKTIFHEPLGKRCVYPFNLADQYIVSKTQNIENVFSYFCYDSKITTLLLSILKNIGIFCLLKYRPIYNMMLKYFIFMLSVNQKFKLGSDVYSLKIDAVGIKDGKEHFCNAGVIGYNNSLLTGNVIVFVAKQLYAKSYSHGIFYLEELFSIDDLEECDIIPKIELNITDKVNI